MVYNIRGGRVKNLLSCMFFLFFSPHSRGRAVYGVGLRSLVGISGSNPVGGMDVSVL